MLVCTTQKNNAFRARILNSSEVSGKYHLPLSSFRDKIAHLDFVLWPVFETLTEINHFMDPCVLYSIPFPLGVRWSGEYLPCRGWKIVYCPVSEAPACSQCKILIMPLHLPLLDGKFILILNLWLNTIDRLFLWKRFLVFFFCLSDCLKPFIPALRRQ